MTSSNEEAMLDGIAVIGLAGRFPGAASVEQLWENLKAGRESIHHFSDEDLLASGVPEHLVRDPAFVKARGLMDDPEMFDAAFFGISPHEAELMDPQHRLFLETCWHALENAGYAPASVEGLVGVWGGVSTGMANDTYLHENLGGAAAIPEEDVLSALLGNENDYLTTRVSYKLNLRGPSVNVQTACSTSLVAVVQAFQSLLTYGCDMALAGGVSVSYPQKNGYVHQEGGIGSPDGHCRPFDAEAQGTVFSNGVGVVVLKRMEDALRDGDSILAVVRGGATNNDGAAKVSFAAPSVSGQAEVIATALAVADVDAASVTYVETHGTGTPIGDPIEVEGLTRAFRRSTGETGFCALGSVKSNFGHLDSAAGITGFIKAVLCLHHRTLVPTVHFQTPSPRIDWASSPFFVNAETREWATDRLPRRAGVSAFGIGGTNAHVILEEAPTLPPLEPGGAARLVPVSARSAEALRDGVRELGRHLRETPDLRIEDVAYTLQVGRQPFQHRAIAVADDVATAAEIFTAEDRARLMVGEADDAADGIVFLFPGGGAQYLGMGRQLYLSITGFREDVDEGLDLLKEREGVDLRSIWFAEVGDEVAEREFQRPSLQLPAIFILEMALARLLIRWGFEPSALIGHSLGENTAACVAGVLSYADALSLVALRGRLFDSAAAGGMLSVTASADDLRPLLGPELDLAAINGPEQCTVSGPREAIDALAAQLEANGIDARIVPIDIAAHSSLVEPLLEPFEAFLRSIELKPPTIPFVSNRTGTWVTDAQATDPAYWAGHLRDTVRFADGVRTVLDQGRPVFLEVGPGRILSSLVKLSDPSVAPRVAATMRHPGEKATDTHALLNAIGRAWLAGAEVDWERLWDDTPARRIALPGYAFERRRFLIEPRPRSEAGHRDTSTASAGGSAEASGLTGGSVNQAPDEVLRRVLELQAQTNAAIQALLSGGGAGAAGSKPSQDDAPASSAAGAAGPHANGSGGAAHAEEADGDVPTSGAEAEEPQRDRSLWTTSPMDPHRTTDERPDRFEQLGFWAEQLQEPLPVLDLMTDHPRTPQRLARRSVLDAALPDDVARGIESLADSQATSPFVVVLAGYLAALHLETGQSDIAVGTPISGEDSADSGSSEPFANAVTIRCGIRPEGSFSDLVGQVADLCRDAARNRDVSLEAVIQELGLPEDADRSPLFQASFAWKVGDPSALDSAFAFTTDVDLRVERGGDGIGFVADYAAGLFDASTVQEFLEHLVALLRVGVSQPSTLLRELPAAAPGVMERLSMWNDTATPRSGARGLAPWLTEVWGSAQRRPALVAGDEQLTYGELDARSNRLAHHLIEAGVVPGALVGLCLPRTADLVVAVVAVWKAGAGYVPLDPTYPSARLSLMTRRADIRLVLTIDELRDRIDGYDGERIFLDLDADAIAAHAPSTPVVDTDLSDPAYVLFTSGSTGEPKGVRVPGHCVVNFLASMSRRPGFHRSDVLLAVTTLSFDISVLELFLPLRAGGKVVLASQADAMDGPALARLMEEHDVSVLQGTPNTWRLLLAAGWEGRGELRALCGGEAFPRELLVQLLPRVASVWNMYGPTETTVWSACAQLTERDAPIVIGSPIDNTRCYVLDETGRQVPPGVPGELYIGGQGVADGYVGRPEETANRFVPDLVSPDSGRMYRTGDVVRWRRDGALEYLHRTDQQVKLRGFRVELGEVEAALAASPGVRAAAVVLRELGDGPELVGYAVTDVEQWSERGVRESLVERLPAHMLPRVMVRLDELPLTDNGKVDRGALPDPRTETEEVGEEDGVDDGLAPPETEAEAYLLSIWQEVLEMSNISVDDNFFDLGGHSLLAVRTIARIRDERGLDVPLRALLTGTLRTVARQFMSEGAAVTGQAEERAVGRVLGTVKDWISRS